MAAQWPLITARLVALLPTIWTGIEAVYDGPPTTDNPPLSYATIGQTSDGESGSYATEQNSGAYAYIETGTIFGELNCAVGERDITTVRASAFTALNALDGQIRADPRLAILSQEGYFTFQVTLAPAMNTSGTAYRARFALTYFTVT